MLFTDVETAARDPVAASADKTSRIGRPVRDIVLQGVKSAYDVPGFTVLIRYDKTLYNPAVVENSDITAVFVRQTVCGNGFSAVLAEQPFFNARVKNPPSSDGKACYYYTKKSKYCQSLSYAFLTKTGFDDILVQFFREAVRCGSIQLLQIITIY
jgi:hypothetical protein